MTPDFVIRNNDLLPVFPWQLFYSDGTSPNLTAATVQFVMAPVGSTVAKVNAGTTILDTLLATGIYSWVGTDTNTPGDYLAYLTVTFPGGGTATFPNDGFIRLKVTDSFDTAE